MKIFYVLHIRERALADCVDAIRFLCNPAEKQRAHLTVRGPYQKRIDVTAISKKIVGDMVSINSVGNFFDSGQNTVFFHCTAPELRNVWNKPHYPFNPHITLYDGGSKEFARALFGVISRYSYCLRFQAEELEPIQAIKGQESMSLAFAFNSKFVWRALGEKIGPRVVADLSEARKLQLVERLCQHLSAMPSPGQYHNRAFQHRLPL
jgi:hypothetical protein